MAASEVALSLAIIRLLDLLSKPSYKIIHEELRNQISELVSNVQTILSARKHVELSDGHNQETKEDEKQLLLHARDLEKIAEAILANFLQNRISESQEGCFHKVFTRVGLFSVTSQARARKIRDFKKKVGSLGGKFTASWPPPNEGMLHNERASSSLSSMRNREYTSPRVESYILGRDKYVRDLLDWLTIQKNDDDSHLRVLSVVGEKACGKTALVRSVFSRLKIKHHFDFRAWIRVPSVGDKSNRLKNLLVDILKQTPLRDQAKDLEHKQEEQLFEMLYKSLMGLRYLIVLDNLCEASLINELLVPFVDSMNGSRVIVTTPNAEMQKFADPWTPDLQLCPELTDEESKKLLRVSIMGDDNWKLDMILEQKFLRKCNGSPPAISLLGGFLSAVEESNWEALIDRLGQHPTLDDVMRLSFDELPHMMKPCVLYMALFPLESEVPIRRLFQLWAAEGLLAKAADGSVQMPSAEDYFCELESRNLIRVVRRKLDGSARSCRMPAFIHGFLRQKAKDLKLLQIQYSSDSEFDGKQSAPHQQARNPATGYYGCMVRCLQSFALFDARRPGTKAKVEVLLKPSILNSTLILLRVLDLEGVYKPVLPEKFGSVLCNLRYLGLRWTVLDFIPESVGNLLFLETLDLKHTNITKVTSTIWRAKNLRHLYLSEASFDKSNQGQISSGESLNTELQTLWGLFIETDKSPMIDVLEKLQSLKKLGVTCRPGAVKAVTDKLSNLKKLESLRLRSRDLFGQPLQALRLRSKDPFGQQASLDLSKDMKEATNLSNVYLLGSLRPVQDLKTRISGNLKALTLSMSDLEEDPMPVLGELQNLIILRLLGRSFTGQRLFCDPKHFQKLRVLKLWLLEKLEHLIVKNGGLGNLEVLEIRQCEKLYFVSDLDHIKSLKCVSLTGVRVWPLKVPEQLKPCRVVYGH